MSLSSQYNHSPIFFYSLGTHLNENQFVRVHRSFIINIDFIQHLEQTETESYRLILKNGKEIPVSKTGLQRLKNSL
ncbi:MAG: LytTR family DNA-binding domain-containing protein [Ignavibacterium sp.]|uniref:LytTR family DNA-binding domain-containing protein n=1 Tax=Ignavibacterium sp. TaxID=2651167 RepID=UPI00404B0E75